MSDETKASLKQGCSTPAASSGIKRQLMVINEANKEEIADRSAPYRAKMDGFMIATVAFIFYLI